MLPLNLAKKIEIKCDVAVREFGKVEKTCLTALREQLSQVRHELLQRTSPQRGDISLIARPSDNNVALAEPRGLDTG